MIAPAKAILTAALLVWGPMNVQTRWAAAISDPSILEEDNDFWERDLGYSGGSICNRGDYRKIKKGEKFYEEFRFDVTVDEPEDEEYLRALRKKDKTELMVQRLEGAFRAFSNQKNECDGCGDRTEELTILDYAEDEIDDSSDEDSGDYPHRNLKKSQRILKKVKRSKGTASRVSCRDCDRRLGTKKNGPESNECEASLMDSLRGQGLFNVDSADISHIELQDCSKHSFDCLVGRACCGAHKACRCSPFGSSCSSSSSSSSSSENEWY